MDAEPPRSPPPALVWSQPAEGHSDADDDAQFEAGVGAFFLEGGAAGSYAGVTPFLVDEIGAGVFLRPSLAVGGSLATHVTSTWATARLDTCARVSGLYAPHTGVELDLCGGADVGFSYVAAGNAAGSPATRQILPYVALGPTAGLRAEAGVFVLTMRVLLGIDVARDGYVDVTGAQILPGLLASRLEIGLSWQRLRPPPPAPATDSEAWSH